MSYSIDMLLLLFICAFIFIAWKSGAHGFAIVIGICLLAVAAPTFAVGLPTFIVSQIASPLGQAMLFLFFVVLGFAKMFGAAGKIFNGK